MPVTCAVIDATEGVGAGGYAAEGGQDARGTAAHDGTETFVLKHTVGVLGQDRMMGLIGIRYDAHIGSVWNIDAVLAKHRNWVRLAMPGEGGIHTARIRQAGEAFHTLVNQCFGHPHRPSVHDPASFAVPYP